MERRLKARADTGIRLYEFLKNSMGLSRHQISSAKFRKNGILVNEAPQKIDFMLTDGDEVSVLMEEKETGSDHLISPTNDMKMPDILYEDEDILVINKMAGTVVHPSRGHGSDSLANLLVDHYRNKGIHMKIRSIGRLDCETSGCLLYAKNQVAAARLSRQRETGVLQKEYLAFVRGMIEPANGVITFPLAKDDTEKKMKKAVSENGLKAVTHYSVIGQTDYGSIVSVWLETGRTHQIRAHMAFMGYPLLGDVLYGDHTGEIKRTALHACSLRLCHPMTGKEILISAPIPEDMNNLIGEKQL